MIVIHTLTAVAMILKGYDIGKWNSNLNMSDLFSKIGMLAMQWEEGCLHPKTST